MKKRFFAQVLLVKRFFNCFFLPDTVISGIAKDGFGLITIRAQQFNSNNNMITNYFFQYDNSIESNSWSYIQYNITKEYRDVGGMRAVVDVSLNY